MKFSIWDFSSKCDQIRRKLRIWSYLLEKSLMETFIFVQCNYVFTTIPIMLFENIILMFSLNNRPLPLREKCRYSEFFYSVLFPHSECLRECEIAGKFNPNAGKYRPETFQIWTLSTQCACSSFLKMNGRWWLQKMGESPSLYLFQKLSDVCKLHLLLIKIKTKSCISEVKVRR